VDAVDYRRIPVWLLDGPREDAQHLLCPADDAFVGPDDEIGPIAGERHVCGAPTDWGRCPCCDPAWAWAA
jgi:hypothetical protein